jgi:hypothetical protein
MARKRLRCSPSYPINPTVFLYTHSDPYGVQDRQIREPSCGAAFRHGKPNLPRGRMLQQRSKSHYSVVTLLITQDWSYNQISDAERWALSIKWWHRDSAGIQNANLRRPASYWNVPSFQLRLCSYDNFDSPEPWTKSGCWRSLISEFYYCSPIIVCF